MNGQLNLPQGPGFQFFAIVGGAIIAILVCLLCVLFAGSLEPVANAPTGTPAPTQTSTPETDTPQPTVPSPSPEPCQPNANIVGDVTIPPGSIEQAGYPFVKTWRVQNNGTCAWDANYKLVFVSGVPMGPSSAPLPFAQPGAVVDLSLPMNAPQAPGTFQGVWHLLSPSSVLFGTNLVVNIVVPEPSTATPTATNNPTNTATNNPTNTATNTPSNTPTNYPTSTPTLTPTMAIPTLPTFTPTFTPTATPVIVYDFIKEAPNADWFTGCELIKFGGSDNSDCGSALWRQDRHMMEDGTVPDLALETHPNWPGEGYIYGYYCRQNDSVLPPSCAPLSSLQSTDVLHLKVGFLQGTQEGNVKFSVNYQYNCNSEVGCSIQLAQVDHKYDGNLIEQTVSLAKIVGLEGIFILRVESPIYGAPQDDATWTMARIERSNGSPVNQPVGDYAILADGQNDVSDVFGRLVFRVAASANGKEGANINHIDMSILDASGKPVYKHTETTPLFCAFGGNLPYPCNPFPYENGTRFPGGPTVIGNEHYTLKAVIYFTDQQSPLTLTRQITMHY